MTTYLMGGGWGNAINWMDYDKRRIVGWKTPRPKQGDLVTCRMESGKTAIFEMVEIEYCLDPTDMFFATVKDIGYEETGI